jgi:hypothetical protein
MTAEATLRAKLSHIGKTPGKMAGKSCEFVLWRLWRRRMIALK